jgi:hypothetical protein
MRLRHLAVSLAAACSLLVPGGADAAPRAAPPPVWAGSCGIPTTSPVWVDYGWPTLASVFGKPAVVVGGSTGGFPAQMRQAGASTVYFDLYLSSRVGQPSAPADPSGLQDKAQKLYDFAVAQIGCPNPTIVENELFGAGLVTPWSDTNAQYRANVLAFLQALAQRGAHPVLLINSDPYTGGDAAGWWQQVASVADIVREAYIPATTIWKQGPIVGNRTLRTAYRNDVGELTSIGISPQRLGLMVSFSTTKGFGGRNGLEPASAWFAVAKWQALAAKTVAQELGIGSIWSWGWAEWSAAETDADKPAAACVWLWARSASLCDGPAAAGAGFDASLTEGQIVLGAGVQCTINGRSVSSDAIQKLTPLTGDPEIAFTALFQRVVEAPLAPVSPAQVLAAERSIVRTRFNGSRAGYLAALAKAHATVAIARAVIGDELRRARLEAQQSVGPPTVAEVTTFYQSYPELEARLVTTKLPTAWLGNRTRGLLLAATAPEQLFRGGARSVWSPVGLVKVQPLAPAVPLGSLPLSQARPAIVAALEQFARGEAFERWSEVLQQRALATAICARDNLPQPGVIDLSTWLPFLRLG